MKKTISVLLSLVFVFYCAAYSFTAFSADIVGSGYCGGEGDGTNLSWALDESGTLTISGSGEMVDCSPTTSQPWDSVEESITEIVILDGVTSIGDYCFMNCTDLEEISIPSTVARIGSHAIGKSKLLREIILHEGLETIDYYAFFCLSGIESIEIPASVTEIRSAPFSGCTSLTSVSVKAGNEVYYSVSNCIIERANKRLVVAIPSSVVPTDGSIEIIGDGAYMNGKSGYDEIYIPDGVTTIESSAYFGTAVRNQKTIHIPDSVTTFADFAFQSCAWLEEVKLPKNMTNVSNGMFAGCYNIKSVELPDKVTAIGWDAFRKCSSLESIVIPEAVESIGENAFEGSGLKYVFFPGAEEKWNAISIHKTNPVLFGAAVHFNCTDHTFSQAIEVVTPATCISNGTYNEVEACTQCPLTVSTVGRTSPIDPSNHTKLVVVPETEATYNEHGFTEGVRCDDCNLWVSGHEVIHNTLGERIIIREPTEDEEGLAEIYCTVCGESGLYAIEKKSPPSDGGIAGFIRKAARGIINWFLRLIKWLGGKK